MYTVMNMESGNFETEQSDAPAYSTEVLCASWNPVVPLVAEREPHHEAASALPPDLAGADMDAFLSRISVC